MMQKEIAYCGENCTICPAYIATINDDNYLRAETIKKWAHIADFSRFEINCLGCKNNEVIFKPCTKCKIKKCCIKRNLEDCSFCSELDSCNEIIRPSRTVIYTRLKSMKVKRLSFPDK
jgi:hypothetical protein